MTRRTDGATRSAPVGRHSRRRARSRRTCKGASRLQQTTTIDGGTRRFAGATGRFTGTVSATAVAGRKRDGSCDQQHLPLIEIDTVTGSGTLSF